MKLSERVEAARGTASLVLFAAVIAFRAWRWGRGNGKR